MINDKYGVKGFKSLLITKGIKYLEGKIGNLEFDEIIIKIVDYFPDKHAKRVLKRIKNLVGRFYLRLNQWEVNFEQRYKQFFKKNKQEGTSGKEKKKVVRVVERKKKALKRNHRKNKRFQN